MNGANENNLAHIAGTICADATLDHFLYGEEFYATALSVPRLSGAEDILPLTVPGRLLESLPAIGDAVELSGQIRSYNKRTDEGSKLVVTLFAREYRALLAEELMPQNDVQLEGFLCKAPVFRTTPFAREIADLLLAVNRPYHKSDYLPCIAWGRNARFASNLPVGARVRMGGRLQSRTYQKCFEDGTVCERTAYEISCFSLELVQ